MLYQFSTSPFAEKVRRALAYKNLPHAIEEVVRAEVASGRYAAVSKTGKFPVIEDDGICVSDSTDILRHLDAHYPSPPLIPADPRAAALVHIIEDWADESLYFYEMTMRLTWEHNLQAGLDAFAATLPGVSREVLKRGILDSVGALTTAQGIGRKPRAQVIADVERHFIALDALLAGGDWLAGDALSAADLATAAQLGALLYAEEARAALARTQYVVSWLERVDAAAPRPGGPDMDGASLDANLVDPDLIPREGDPPHSLFAAWRNHDPVHWNPPNPGYHLPHPNAGLTQGFWVLTRYKDVYEVSRDQEVFSSFTGGPIIWDHDADGLIRQQAGMMGMPADQHAQLKRLVLPPFAPSALAEFEPEMARVAREIVDGIATRGSCEFVFAVASKLPVYTFCALMGIPPADRNLIFALGNAAADVEREKPAGADPIMDLFAYAWQLAEAKRAAPDHSMMSALVNGQVDGDQLAPPQVGKRLGQRKNWGECAIPPRPPVIH